MSAQRSEVSTPRSPEEAEKYALILIRYVLVLAASYLLLAESGFNVSPVSLFLIAVAFGSNLFVSRIPALLLRKPYIRGIIVCADTGWIVWALYHQGSFGPDFFALYFLVLFLSAIGESVLLIVIAAVFLSAVDLLLFFPGQRELPLWAGSSLMRVPFIFSVALFYSYFVDKVRRERRYALVEKEFSEKMGHVVYAQTTTLREEAEELRMRNEELNQMSKVKDQFLSVVSHELRTPINVITGYLNILGEGIYGPLGGDQTKALDRVEAAANGLLFIVNSLVGLTELPSGRIVRDVFQLRELCRPLIDRYRKVAERKHLVFKEELLEEETVGETDRRRIALLLSHLLDNAVKFTEKGEVVFRAAYDRHGDRFSFEVRDTGVGFPQGIIPKLLAPFEQRDMSETRRYGGIGIGLTLVKEYADFLHGTLHISSKEGGGTSFLVEIPAHAS